MAGWRSTIQTMALLHPATTICVLAEFPIQPQQLGWRKKAGTVDRTNSIYHGNTETDANR